MERLYWVFNPPQVSGPLPRFALTQQQQKVRPSCLSRPPFPGQSSTMSIPVPFPPRRPQTLEWLLVQHIQGAGGLAVGGVVERGGVGNGAGGFTVESTVPLSSKTYCVCRDPCQNPPLHNSEANTVLSCKWSHFSFFLSSLLFFIFSRLTQVATTPLESPVHQKQQGGRNFEHILTNLCAL